ncbi:MAG: hypothetical protein ACO3BY_03550 [Aquiluna sp.]
MRWLVLLPILTGCAAVDFERVEESLNQYAQSATKISALEKVLTGGALQSAIESAQLLEELKISQSGIASFELQEASGGKAKGCLDLSEVQFVDAGGEYLPVQREPRVRFSASYTPDFLISELEVSEQPC